MAILCIAVAVWGLIWLVGANRAPLREAKKRQAQHKELRLEHWMAIGFRQAAWLSVLVGGAGAATARWWRGPTRKSATGNEGGLPVESESSAPRMLFWLGVTGAVAIGAFYRAPRLGHSFWNDEAYAARAYVWGVKQPQADGSLSFKPVDWKTALFLNEKANNHVWCSLEARLALKAWQKLTGRGADVFNEAAMRLPAFLWGLGGIAALGVLGRISGGWMVGILSASLLALHPWHVRYGEMRGYAAMLLALTLGLVFLIKAIESRRWRWWGASAAMNLWAMLAFAGSLWFPLAAALLAARELWRQRDWTSLARMLLVNGLASVAFMWCFGPSLPQLGAYLRSGAEADGYRMSWGWFHDLWAGLVAGVPWSSSFISLNSQTGGPLLAAGSVLVVGAGFGGMIAARTRERFVALAMTGATFLTLIQNALTRSPMVVWYLLPALLGWVIAFAFLTGRLTMATQRLQFAATCVAALGLIGWIAGTAEIRHAITHRDRQPMRQAALFVTHSRPDAITGVIGVSDRQMLLYDPHVAVLKSPVDLDALEQQAAALKRPVVIYRCGLAESERRVPELVARLQSPDYARTAEFPGLEEMFSYYLYERK